MTKNRFQNGSGAYTCDSCNKLTRDTGHGEAALHLCRHCLYECQLENAESDCGKDSEEYKTALEEFKQFG